MKVIQVINSLGNGGAEKFVVELSNGLSKQNEVLLCSLKEISDDMIFPKQLLPSVRCMSFFKKSGFDPSVYFKLSRLLRKEKPGVVHFHLDATIKYILPLLLFFRKISFVHTVHSDLNAEKKKVFGQLYKLKFLSRRIHFVCISDRLERDFKKRYPAFRFSTIYNGIERPQSLHGANEAGTEIAGFRRNDATKVIVAVGRIDRNKNHALLLDVFAMLEKENVVCIIIGDDPSPEKRLLKELKQNTPANLFFLGSKKNVAAYLSAADAFIMSSLEEGLPISALEAYGAGLPLICTPAGGLVDIVEPGKNGFLAADFTKEELFVQVKKFLSLGDRDLQQMKKANLEKFEMQFLMSGCVERYSHLYENVAAA